MRSKPVRRKPRGSYFSVETLESRILYAADLPGIAEFNNGYGFAETRQWQPATSSANDESVNELNVVSELVFVDVRVDDLASLLADLERRATSEFKVVLIEADENAIDRISETLADYRGLKSLHLVSHGDDGLLQLGRDPLDLNALLGDAEAVGTWASSFAPDADMLIYGCDLAATEAGRNFVDTLANLTGTDVAASSDTTGSVAAGGNWNLEYTRGNVQSELAFSEQMQNDYVGTFATYLVSNLDDIGSGSLREAITSANTSGTDDLIEFSVAGTINLTSVLPSITNTVTIDATTAPGYADAPVVTLDGSAISDSSADGLRLYAGSDNSHVKGLAIVDFPADGIVIQNSSAHIIELNHIGTDGSVNLGNAGVGIRLSDAGGNLIGGSTAAQRNVISGNGDHGIHLSGAGSTSNVIAGNYIGTGANGTTVLGNGSSGILISDGASANLIGGDAISEGNRIANNVGNGISVTGASSNNNAILLNIITDNGALAIDLGATGVNTNDAQDSDTGANSGYTAISCKKCR